MFGQRTERFLALVNEIGAQGAIVHKPSNMRWLSGYTGEGLLFIAAGVRAVITDFRYTEQAEQQALGYSVHMITQALTHEKLAAELAGSKGVKIIAFEDDFVTVKGAESLKAAMPDARFISVNQKAEKLRTVKDESEIALIEKACAISCQAFDAILGIIRPGMTELEIRFELESLMYRFGAEKPSFDTIIASGPNGSLPHAIPGSRVIQTGEMLTMDFGARYGGYCADMTRTVAIGPIDGAKRRVYDTVLAAQLKALEAIKPNMVCSEVDKVARSFIDDAGYAGRFGHGLGHSIGLDVHENPRFSTTCDAVLEEGIVITDEPGVYLPGDCGCRIEDTVLVTGNGCRRLTPAAKELIIL